MSEIRVSNLTYRLPDGPSPSSTNPLVDQVRYRLGMPNHRDGSPFIGKTLLRDVSFTAKPGELVALMGPSGAGKSTLLDVISSRKYSGTAIGRVTIVPSSTPVSDDSAPNALAHPKAFASFCQRNSAYVRQDDLHLATLTVCETLTYAARLRLGGDGEAAVRERVEFLIDMLNLKSCRDSFVGDALNRGISGGQLKRLSIGVECVTLPDIIFLDEMTSGLDSAIALEVVKSVRSLVSNGNRTVVTTIHQPSAECFELFDGLLLLSLGRVVYAGSSKSAPAYFQSLGYVWDGVSNPADFVVDVAAGSSPCYGDGAAPESGPEGRPKPSFGRTHIKSPVELARCFRAYKEEEEAQRLGPGGRSTERRWTSQGASERRPSDRAEEGAGPRAALPTSDASALAFNPNVHAGSGSGASIYGQFATLLSRGSLCDRRNVSYRRAQILKNIIVGAITGCIFYQQGTLSSAVFSADTNLPTSSGYNVASILFFALLYALTGNIQAIPILFNAKLLFIRERESGAYTTLPYFLANAVVYLPLIIFTHLFFVNLTYWLVGLPAIFSTFAYMTVLTLFVNLMSFSVAQLLAARSSSSAVALALFPVVFMFLSNFAGFTILIENVQSFWCWAPYVSFPRWAYEGLVTITFENSKPEEYEALLDYFGFTGYDTKLSFIVLIPYWVFINILVLIALLPSKSALKSFESLDDERRSKKGRRNESSASTDLLSFAGKASKPLLSEQFLEDGTGDGRAGGYGGEGGVVDDEDDEDDEDVQAIVTSPLIDSGGEADGRLSSGDPNNCSRVQSGPREMPEGDPVARRGSLSVADFRRNSEGILPASSGGLNVTFNLLHYGTMSKGHPRADENGMLHIVKSASGRAASGEMVALMGASGAGKSTLLDILAGRKTLGKDTVLDGTLLFNGTTRTRAIMRRSAYVTQDNVHLESLTVQQTLQFAAALRMEGSNATERAQRVLDIAKMLGLDGVLGSNVGGQQIRGISGGQLKRLSIAVEIIHLPELIFLDEPTTGLDHSLSYEVMCAVRNLADQRRTVIATIHQPSPATFELFDKLLLLGDGRTLYFGPAKLATGYFCDTFGFKFDGKKNGANPAEFVVAVAGGFEEPVISVDNLADTFGKSVLFKGFSSGIEDMVALDRRQDVALGKNNTGSTYPTSLLAQCITLGTRQVLKTLQNKKPIIAGIFRHIVVALFYGSIYYNLQPTEILERLSLCFFTIMFVTMGHQQSIPTIFEERLLFYRERGAKIYGNFGYWLTGNIALFPVTVMNIAIFCSTLYMLTGFKRELEAFLFFCLVTALTSLNGLFFSQLLSVLCPSQQTAITLFPALLFFFISFAGYIVQLPSLPTWISSWAPLISFVRFGFAALAINEFKDNLTIFPDVNLFVTNKVQYDKFAELYGFEDFSKWSCVLFLVVSMAVFRLLTFLAVRYIRWEKR